LRPKLSANIEKYETPAEHSAGVFRQTHADMNLRRKQIEILY